MEWILNWSRIFKDKDSKIKLVIMSFSCVSRPQHKIHLTVMRNQWTPNYFSSTFKFSVTEILFEAKT